MNFMNRMSRAFIPLLFASGIAFAQQAVPPAQTTVAGQKGPVLAQRPLPGAVSTEGRIQLDVLVTRKQGGAVPGLEIKDFTLLDDKQEQKILGFHAEDGNGQTTPMEVILVLDTVNGTFQQAAFARQQTAKFLALNGGRVDHPTLIAVFSNEVLRIQPRPSTDGTVLAKVLDQASANIQSVGSAAGSFGEMGRFQLSVRTLTAIADNEAKKPGKKILIWIGSGWPMLVGSNFSSSPQDRQRLFDAIVELSTRLREAHIALYSISPLNAEKASAVRMPPAASIPTTGLQSAEAPPAPRVMAGDSGAVDEAGYKEFLKGVKSVKQADTANLALQVLAVQSGGRVLNPSNDLSDQIVECLQDLNAFYTLSFNPPHAQHPDEYHELRVVVSRSGLTARTSNGYYNQP
jgi:VWFA-related protein